MNRKKFLILALTGLIFCAVLAGGAYAAWVYAEGKAEDAGGTASIGIGEFDYGPKFTVTFKIVNGTWKNPPGSTEDKVVLVDVGENGKGTLKAEDIPTINPDNFEEGDIIPNSGHGNGYYTPSPSGGPFISAANPVDVEIDKDYVYTFTCQELPPPA